MLGGLAGDRLAYEGLLRKSADALRPYFARRLSRGADVDDLVQECLIAVHKKRATFDRSRPFLPWLRGIAQYKLVDHYRRTRAGTSTKEFEEADWAVEFESASSARMDVESLLETLPPKQREAIRATKVRGESVAEAASASGMSPSDIKVSVHRGMKALAALTRGRSQ